jgi:anti-sigma-K factor RskA
MRYDNPELQHRLAAEYVLGTLQGRARRRFEFLLAGNGELRARVAAWEARLSPWTVAASPVPVPDRVWAGIRQRLGHGVAAGSRWRGWALAGMATAAALAVVLVLRPAPAPRALHDVAVLSTDKAVATWIVRASSDGRHLALSGLLPAAVPSGHDLELWAIPAQGAPQSLGVLHRSADGAATLDLDTVRRARFAAAAVLAVSLEPAGGSPTGAPTGPVLYTGRRAG